MYWVRFRSISSKTSCIYAPPGKGLVLKHLIRLGMMTVPCCDVFAGCRHPDLRPACLAQRIPSWFLVVVAVVHRARRGHRPGRLPGAADAASPLAGQRDRPLPCAGGPGG